MPHVFVHPPRKKCTLKNTCYVPDTVLSVREATVNKQTKILLFWTFYSR